MRHRLFAVLSAAVAAVVGIVLVASVATAATLFTTTPYPSVPINPNVCQAERIKVDQAQLVYDQALREYNRLLQLGDAAAESERRAARRKADEAAIALNNAKYAQATCQNNAANPADKNCVNLALELNRLIDELAITKDLEAIAKAEAEAATALYQRNAMSREEYERYITAYNVAKLQTQLIEQQIADQRARTTAAGCQNVDRPATPSPTPSSPAPSSPAPSSPAPSSPAPSSPAPSSPAPSSPAPSSPTPSSPTPQPSY